MNGKQDELIAQLFKDTLITFLLSMFAATIGNIIDGVITGNFLGADSLAAFGFTVPYQLFTTIFPAVLALGMQVLCGKSLGRGNLREANGNFSLAMTTALALMIFLTGATFLFAEQIADLLGASESLGAIRSLTIDYLEVFSLSLPALAAVTILTPIMQLDSDRNRAVISVVVLSVSDILGDLACVFVFDGGLWGMGIATAISYWLAAGVLILHFFKPNASFAYLPESMQLKNFCGMILAGLPVILGRGLSVLCVGILTRVALTYAGGTGVAAFAAVFNFLALLEIIPKALSSATQMIMGILIGEQDKHSMLRLMKLSLKSSLAISLAMTAAVLLAAPIIAELYTKDAAAYQMTLEGIRWVSLPIAAGAVALTFNYYYNSCGKYRLSTLMSVLNNIGFIVPFALILTPYLAMTGLWAASSLRYFALALVVFPITWRHCRRITFRLEDYLLLSEDFDVAGDKQLNITVTNKAEVMNLSERAQNFCEASGIDGRRSMFASICIEEMAGNIVEYGFGDGKKHFVDVRVIVKGAQVIIRIRDDCRSFDPKNWAEIYNSEDPTAHIGIRLVRKISTEFKYVNVLKLNNLIIKI